jgi:hypothetical protein
MSLNYIMPAIKSWKEGRKESCLCGKQCERQLILPIPAIFYGGANMIVHKSHPRKLAAAVFLCARMPSGPSSSCVLGAPLANRAKV